MRRYVGSGYSASWWGHPYRNDQTGQPWGWELLDVDGRNLARRLYRQTRYGNSLLLSRAIIFEALRPIMLRRCYEG